MLQRQGKLLHFPYKKTGKYQVLSSVLPLNVRFFYENLNAGTL